MNDVKSLIQKEEYISLALNKYILQTGTIPKDVESLDWAKLMVDDYLGVNFNKKNPITSNDIVVTFDANNNAYIKGAIEKEVNYQDEYKYLYNFNFLEAILLENFSNSALSFGVRFFLICI